MELTFKIISSPGPQDASIHDFIAENDNDFYPPIAARRDLKDFVQSVYDHKGKYIICYENDRIVGLTSVYLNHPSFITYYHYVAVNKDYRHKGIATELYNRVHAICREIGVQRAIVKTWSTNKTSQSMFNKHGFFHLDTLEDDRSPGVHTYFFAKSFAHASFKKPVTRLAILGGGNNYALGQIAKTISAIPRSNAFDHNPVQYTAISATYPSSPAKNEEDKKAVITGLKNMLTELEQQDVSHLLVIDQYNFPYIDGLLLNAKIEIIDLARVTRELVNIRGRKCMLVAADIPAAMRYFDINNVHVPGHADYLRIQEIISEIKAGYVSPSYYKHEVAKIALLNDCDCVILGSAELHNMFGTDKMYDGLEIFDPWMELAIIIQQSRMDALL